MTTGLAPVPTDVDTDYPPAPWQMHGQLWLSLFRIKEGERPGLPRGIHGLALVRYDEPSPLTYGELLVAHLAEKSVTISDIWVDSPASMRGGRELWAIPKDLCDFSSRIETRGPVTRARWSTSLDGRPIATAWFSDVSRYAPRLPFKGRTLQHREDGTAVIAHLTGSSRALPCRGSWSFDQAGPLGWLHGKRPVASFRQADFAMSFG